MLEQKRKLKLNLHFSIKAHNISNSKNNIASDAGKDFLNLSRMWPQHPVGRVILLDPVAE